MPLAERYVARFVEELGKRGVSLREIRAFERYCESLPACSTQLPCPFCFTAERRGGLAKRAEVAGLNVLQCENCDVSVVVRGP